MYFPFSFIFSLCPCRQTWKGKKPMFSGLTFIVSSQTSALEASISWTWKQPEKSQETLHSRPTRFPQTALTFSVKNVTKTYQGYQTDKWSDKNWPQRLKSGKEISNWDINAKEEIGYSILDQSIKRQYPKWNRIPTSYTPTSFLD